MTKPTDLRTGTRVRVRTAHPKLLFESLTGWVVHHSRWEGQYLIHLDQPARLVHRDGWTEWLPEIYEVAEHLEPLE